MSLNVSLNFENDYVALTANQLEYGGNAIDLSCMFKLEINIRYGRICRIQKNLLDRVSKLYWPFSLSERLKADNTVRVNLPIRRIHQGRYGVSVPALTKDHKDIKRGPYSKKSPIRRDLDNSTSNVLIPLDSWTSRLLVYRLPLSAEYGVSTSIGYGVSSSLSNTAYSLKLINTAYLLPLDTAYRSMTKVIKGEFEKIKDVKVEDVPLTYDKPLEVFNNEVSRLSGMDDDLFTYEVEVANIPCDSKMDDDSEQEVDDDMGGDDEVELIDEESSDDEDNTYEDYKNDWIYKWNKDVPWVDEKPWTNTGVWTKPTPVKHTYKPFNYKTGCSEWPTCGWKDDGYCNGGNLPGTYIIENQLHYQDYEWYEALEDSELKDEGLRNKAIMEGFVKEDDDKSLHELPVCNVRRYMMIKYSFNDNDEYVAVKEDEYDDLTVTRKEACRAYQEIFQIMDEGWTVTKVE
ncbi:hypothetical protein Tco_0688163 [Tanacetum coccineum]